MTPNKCCLGDLRVVMIRSWVGGRSQTDRVKREGIAGRRARGWCRNTIVKELRASPEAPGRPMYRRVLGCWTSPPTQRAGLHQGFCCVSYSMLSTENQSPPRTCSDGPPSPASRQCSLLWLGFSCSPFWVFPTADLTVTILVFTHVRFQVSHLGLFLKWQRIAKSHEQIKCLLVRWSWEVSLIASISFLWCFNWSW